MTLKFDVRLIFPNIAKKILIQLNQNFLCFIFATERHVDVGFLNWFIFL